jgi:hypothetical protein
MKRNNKKIDFPRRKHVRCNRVTKVTIMEVEGSFQTYTRAGERVILKYDTRKRVVL